MILIHLEGKCIPRGRRGDLFHLRSLPAKKEQNFWIFRVRDFIEENLGVEGIFAPFFSKFREGIHKEDRNVFLSCATVAFPRIEIFYFSPPPPSNPLTARCPLKGGAEERKHSQRDISPQTPLLFPHTHRPTRLLLLCKRCMGCRSAKGKKRICLRGV